MIKLNREVRRNKKANKVSKWIIDSILKLPTGELWLFHDLIMKELSCRHDFLDSFNEEVVICSK